MNGYTYGNEEHKICTALFSVITNAETAIEIRSMGRCMIFMVGDYLRTCASKDDFIIPPNSLAYSLDFLH